MKLRLTVFLGMMCLLLGSSAYADSAKLQQIDAQMGEAKASQTARMEELRKSLDDGAISQDDYQSKVAEYAKNFQKQMGELEKSFHAALGSGDTHASKAAVPAAIEVPAAAELPEIKAEIPEVPNAPDAIEVPKAENALKLPETPELPNADEVVSDATAEAEGVAEVVEEATDDVALETVEGETAQSTGESKTLTQKVEKKVEDVKVAANNLVKEVKSPLE